MVASFQQNGFTLLELVVAMGLFTAGLLGLTLMTSGLMTQNKTTMQRATATRLAQNKMEMLLQKDYSEVSDHVEEGLDASGVPGNGAFRREVTVEVSHDPGFKGVDVTVMWQSKGDHHVTLMSIIAAP